MVKLMSLDKSHYLNLGFFTFYCYHPYSLQEHSYSREKNPGTIQQFSDYEQVRERLLLHFNGFQVAIQYIPSSFSDISTLAHKELML